MIVTQYITSSSIFLLFLRSANNTPRIKSLNIRLPEKCTMFLRSFPVGNCKVLDGAILAVDCVKQRLKPKNTFVKVSNHFWMLFWKKRPKQRLYCKYIKLDKNYCIKNIQYKNLFYTFVMFELPVDYFLNVKLLLFSLFVFKR